MAERERLRKQGVGERAREALGSRGQGKGDLSAACDAMSQGLVLVDEKNRVTYANGAAAVFLRCKRDDLVGGEVGRFLQVKPVIEAVEEIVTAGGRRRTVHDIERKDDTSSTAEGLEYLRAEGARIMPALLEHEVTAVYVGLRAATEHVDYQVSIHADEGYACVGGVRSTGLSASMALGEHVRSELEAAGLRIVGRWHESDWVALEAVREDAASG